MTTPPTIRSTYLAVLRAAMTCRAQGEMGAALHGFLSLNAGYFLGEWLPEKSHRRLVTRLVRRLDGLADLPVPSDETAALQLAQHAHELAAAFGPTLWTERIARLTVQLVPTRRPAQPRRFAVDLHDVAGGKDATSLLRLHAERRLWALTHLEAAAEEPLPVPAWALTLALEAAESADGHAVQVAEAALSELAYGV